jgi:ubiquinol-cytochrome c reductase iron-sulfur subunit
MSDREIIEERHPVGSTPEEAAGTLEQFYLGTEESGFGRRRLIRGTLIGSLGLLGIPPLILLRDLGPLPTLASERTAWAPGMRVVNDVTLTPIRPADVEIGQLVNAEPAIVHHLHGADLQVVKADSAVILVRMRPEEINAPVGRADWGVDGILCFSKVCTHVGCPISLYEQQTKKLLCPCHQSTFDLANGARVTFGPAARSLPQLPIEVDDEGYLVARSDFLEPVGPSYWERG